MRIIFMGTPDFAVESLKALVENGKNVVAVVTMPDKPAGRGYKMQSSPVKQFALDNHIPLLQPEKLKDPLFLQTLKYFNADLQIVVAFRMLPETVWNMPRLGTFNLHASLLPQYRGAAPINWAIINGEKKTGVTTFFLTHEIDTGRIILQEDVTIDPSDNAGTLHDKLMYSGGKLVLKTAELIESGIFQTTDQALIPVSDLRMAPKIFKETCKIDFFKTTDQIHNFVRGLAPYPCAWAELQFSSTSEVIFCKIFETSKEKITHQFPCGNIITDGKKYAKVAVKDGFIQILSLQPAGKNRMEIGEYLRGIRL